MYVHVNRVYTCILFSSQFLISLIVIFDLVVLVIKKDVFWFTRMNVVSVKHW